MCKIKLITREYVLFAINFYILRNKFLFIIDTLHVSSFSLFLKLTMTCKLCHSHNRPIPFLLVGGENKLTIGWVVYLDCPQKDVISLMQGYSPVVWCMKNWWLQRSELLNLFWHLVNTFFLRQCNLNLTKIVAAFWGMHVSSVKHSYAWLPRKCDRQTPDKMIPMCCYASQATQKLFHFIPKYCKTVY